MAKERIKIEGMSCTGCSSNIEKQLNAQKGVLNAIVSLEDKEAVIEYDEGITGLKVFTELIEDLGFDVIA